MIRCEICLEPVEAGQILSPEKKGWEVPPQFHDGGGSLRHRTPTGATAHWDCVQLLRYRSVEQIRAGIKQESLL